MKFQQDACCVAESIFIITRKSSEVVMLVIFRHDADPIHKTRMRIQCQKLLIRFFIIFEFQQWIFHLFVRHGASSFLRLFSEHSAHDFHALWVERMSGTLAEGRSDLGVRLAPAAVAVGEAGHSEDTGQHRYLSAFQQLHHGLDRRRPMTIRAVFANMIGCFS